MTELDVDVIKRLPKNCQDIFVMRGYFLRKAVSYRDFGEGILRVHAQMETALKEDSTMKSDARARMLNEYTKIVENDKRVAQDAFHDASIYFGVAEALQKEYTKRKSQQ